MSRPRGRTPSERRWAMDGPSARAVGQRGEPREPDAGGRTSGGGLSFGDFSLATQRKVTRPSPKGGRNPVEGRALAFHAAQPLKRGQPLARESGESLSSWSGLFPAVQCAALIAPYGVPLRGKATPSHPIRECPNTLRYSNLRAAWRSRATTSTSRTSDYASLIKPTEKPTADAG